MKLTTEQINDIQTFIRKKGYSEPDLLIEMLDHVACLVEEKMDRQAELAFDSALQITYSDFGFFGFSKLAEGIIKGRKLAVKGSVKRVLRTVFSFPYILLVLATGIFLFHGYILFYKPFIVMVPLVILTAYFGYYFGIIRPAGKPFKAYLWIETTNNFTVFMTLGLNAFHPFVHLAENTPLWAGIFSVWIISLSLLIICYFTFYNEALKKCKELQEVYGSLV